VRWVRQARHARPGEAVAGGSSVNVGRWSVAMSGGDRAAAAAAASGTTDNDKGCAGGSGMKTRSV
jgi:hypothetical protein